MAPETVQTVDFALRLVDTLGTLGILILALVLFYRGDIMSKNTVERMLTESREQVKTLAQEIIQGMDGLEEPIVKAVHEAVRTALLEFSNNMNSGNGNGRKRGGQF